MTPALDVGVGALPVFVAPRPDVAASLASPRVHAKDMAWREDMLAEIARDMVRAISGGRERPPGRAEGG